MDFDSDSAFTDSSQKEGRNYVKFYTKWKRNNFLSEQEGREVGENADYILIISPGNAKTEVRREVRAEDKVQYAPEWSAYEQGRENQVAGTPIETLPGLPDGIADALKALYIYTIEQLAGLSDINLQKIGMGGAEMRQKAKTFLTGTNAETLTLREQLQAAQIRITTLETANTAQAARIADLEAAAKPVKKAAAKTKGAAAEVAVMQ